MRFSFIFIIGFLMLAPAYAMAQQPPSAAPDASGGLPDRIVRPMRAIDPMTLKAEGANIRLWGIKPARTSETPLELKALDLMDALIHEQQVNCKIVGGAFPDLVGRCATQNNEDLALALLENGFVVVDRQQTYNSVFATGYEKAQEAARLKTRGVWRYVNDTETDASATPKWLKPYLDWLLPLSLIVGPFGGLLIVALMMRAGLKRLADRQAEEAEQAGRKETAMQTRERQVLASTLEGELLENKNKVEAFVTIYGDLLHTLKTPVETPKYQQGGDIVQKSPVFSKTVFEANVNRLSLLDIKVAGLISKLYTSLPSTPEYITIEPHVPLETAQKLVEKIVHEAEAMIAPLDEAAHALQAAGQKAA